MKCTGSWWQSRWEGFLWLSDYLICRKCALHVGIIADSSARPVVCMTHHHRYHPYAIAALPQSNMTQPPVSVPARLTPSPTSRHQVRHPHVSDAIERDFKTMTWLAHTASALMPSLREFRLEDTLKQFEAPLHEQVGPGVVVKGNGTQ